MPPAMVPVARKRARARSVASLSDVVPLKTTTPPKSGGVVHVLFSTTSFVS